MKTPELAPGVAVVCTDAAVPPADLKAYAAAQTKQLAEACEAWGREAIACVLYDSLEIVPKGMPFIVIQKAMSEAGALAFHTEEGDVPDGFVGTDICREAGVPWQSAASHEVLEAAFDAYVGGWQAMPSGRSLMAREVCDPVQDGTYEIDGVPMSNYVLPAYFDPQSVGGQYDRMGVLEAPFTRTADGYYIQMAVGKTSQVGDRRLPATEGVSRGARRLGAGNDDALDERTLKLVLEQAKAHGAPVEQIVRDCVRAARARASA